MSIVSSLKGDDMLPLAHLNCMLPAKVPQFGVWVRCLLPGVGGVFPDTNIQPRLVAAAHYLCPLLLSCLHLYVTLANAETQLIEMGHI